jgi:hypothetical protein
MFVVGKEQRAFAVDRLMLDSYSFRLLLETAARKEERRGSTIFVDVDAIIFEHILWLSCAWSILAPALPMDLARLRHRGRTEGARGVDSEK